MIPVPMILRVLPILVRIAIDITRAIRSESGDGKKRRLEEIRAAARRLTE